ncbi:DUF2793 domain-containing protein [Robiginitomaculum antarcticum]|uniref:DUF2793 domain-containing protein n=1 Tax=Robiginitomaculum antarcticum TaxID=437507 RepID=UPI00036051F4|nr:DUF2793 domain-containing protein [Robiginitomaculum antarcticum]
MPTYTTEKFQLPYMAPSQASKHITHNEALQRLDTGLYLAVSDFATTQIPIEPDDGLAIIIGETPDPHLTQRAGQIAVFQDGTWVWFTPAPGWVIWSLSEARLRVFDGLNWVFGDHGAPVLDELPQLGLNATASEAQRLAISSETTLFNHDGTDHRLNINRATAGDTASLVLQTGFTGQAEIGLSGSEGLAVKTNMDGSEWTTRLSCPDDTPGVSAPAFRSRRIVVQADGTAVVPTPGHGGLVAITLISEVGYPRSSHSGIFVYDTGLSLKLITLAALDDIENHDTMALTGTVSTPDRTGLAVQSGALVLENRTTVPRDYSVTFIG